MGPVLPLFPAPASSSTSGFAWASAWGRHETAVGIRARWWCTGGFRMNCHELCTAEHYNIPSSPSSSTAAPWYGAPVAGLIC